MGRREQQCRGLGSGMVRMGCEAGVDVDAGTVVGEVGVGRAVVARWRSELSF